MAQQARAGIARRLVHVLTAVALAVPATAALVGTAEPASAAIGSTSKFGYNAVNQVDEPARVADMMRDAGFKWSRLYVNWTRMQPAPGVLDTTWLHSRIDEMRARGMSVLIVFQAPVPVWAQDKQEPCPKDEHRPPKNPEDFKNFTKLMAREFGAKVAAWEIWNEPEGPACWRYPGTAKHFTEHIFLPGFDGLREVLPGATILGPSVAAFDNYLTYKSAKDNKRYLLRPISSLSIHKYASVDATKAEMNRAGKWKGCMEKGSPYNPPGMSQPYCVESYWLTEFGFDKDGAADRPAKIMAYCQAQAKCRAALYFSDAFPHWHFGDYALLNPTTLVPRATYNNLSAYMKSAAPKPAWHGFENWAGPATTGAAADAKVASVSFGPGHVDTFQIRNSRLEHRYRVGSSLSAWEALPGNVAVTGIPSAVSWDDSGRIDVFARTTANRLAHWWYSTTTGWRSGGTHNDTALASDPAALSFRVGHLDVFWKSAATGGLTHKSWNDTAWSAPQALGGSMASAPVPVSWAPGHADIFYRATNNVVTHSYFTGTAWSAPVAVAGMAITGTPAATSWSPGRIDVFGRAANGSLAHYWFQNGASGVDSLAGCATGDPSATSLGPNHLDVFVRGCDNKLYHRVWNGSTWVQWASLGGTLTSSPSAMSVGSERIDVFVRGGGANLYRTWFGA
jgi:hypothetical protein